MFINIHNTFKNNHRKMNTNSMFNDHKELIFLCLDMIKALCVFKSSC